MKQKIKKLAYTIPLDSDYIHDANIVVAKINVPSKKDKKKTTEDFRLFNFKQTVMRWADWE